MLALADELFDEVPVDYLSSDADLGIVVDMSHQGLELSQILLLKITTEGVDVFFFL